MKGIIRFFYLFRLALLVAGSFILFVPSLKSQVILSDPALPTDQDVITITFNATGTPLQAFTGDVYAHTGLIIEGNPNWQYVIGNWGNNTTQPRLTRIDPNIYQLEISPDIRQFYNVNPNDKILRLAFVFRAASNSPQSEDLFIDVYEAGMSVSVISPSNHQPIIEFGEIVNVLAVAREADELKLYINDDEVATTTSDEIEYVFNSTEFGYGSHWIIATALDADSQVYDSVYVFVRSEPNIAALPEGVRQGINYIDDYTVTLVLHDPPATKDWAFVFGDFNNWSINQDGYMNTTSDGTYFWITLTDLEPGKEYGFQYFVHGNIRMADPYTEKVLDPWHDDEIISQGRYPGLIPYPKGKTEHPVSVFQTAREPYQWEVTDFTPPAIDDLVIYELLIRDFLQNNTYQQLKDTLAYLKRLGINAIELMPVTNFEGNLSWGYNPSFFFAPDKFYGPRRELKRFVDEAHKLGMAVILDMVWNHSFGQSPLLRMYFDGNNNRPAQDNPWYSNPIFANTAMNFGYKFDHGSPYFIEFMDRANKHWLEEYNIDGFRFDLTKGFTTRFKGSNDEWGSNFDQERVDNLIRLYNQIKQVKPHAYVILEHLADNAEETVLANNGMLLWGNVTHAYQEAAMGWLSQSNFSWASYKNRNWNSPNLIAYMESHDEERIMFKNITYGNSSNPDHDVKQLPVALQRAGLAAAFYFTIPGPKMIWQFGELGYDYSINHCPNGTIADGCRTSPKPVRWDYYSDPDRKKLYDTYSLLINLKKEHDVFRTTDYTLSLGGAGKRIHLNHASNNVTVVGNFGLTEADFNPNFQQEGLWYEYFTRRRINVSDVTNPIRLKPGEFRLYSTLEFPDHGLKDLFDDGRMETEEGMVRLGPNPSTDRMVFSLMADHDHHIHIYDLSGRLIFSQDNVFGQSKDNFNWDGRTSDGSRPSGGIYFYRIFSDRNSYSGKIILFENN
jgi:1,4-alpha-glucan branching enzyme